MLFLKGIMSTNIDETETFNATIGIIVVVTNHTSVYR